MSSDIKLRNIQLSILEILKDIITVCEEYNIEYFIIFGTALGAVRHKGFIPWDDDLDIGMTRQNYERFLEVAVDALPQDLFLQTFNSEPNTPFYFSKVRKNGTVFVEKYCKDLEIHRGIYVDIFPYDNIPDDMKLRKKQHRKVDIWSNLFIAKTLKGSSVPQKTLAGKMKILVRTVFHYLLKPVSKQSIYNKLDSASQEYNTYECKEQSFVKSPSCRIPTKDLNNLAKIEFEEIKVSCPPNIEAHLELCYGNYMELPPREKRIGHRPYRVEL